MGVNYDHDDAGNLLEDYWASDWPRVVEDMREIKALGANVVRIHLQVGKFMTGTDQANQKSLDKLGELVRLAEELGLTLDVTGLACYHKADVPACTTNWMKKVDGGYRRTLARAIAATAKAVLRFFVTT